MKFTSRIILSGVLALVAIGIIRRSDDISGIGEIVLMPVMRNPTDSPDFKISYRSAVHAPTGRHEVGRLVDTGKNYRTLGPTVGCMYFGKVNGREASLLFGRDHDFIHPDTHHEAGAQLQLVCLEDRRSRCDWRTEMASHTNSMRKTVPEGTAFCSPRSQSLKYSTT